MQKEFVSLDFDEDLYMYYSGFMAIGKALQLQFPQIYKNINVVLF